MTNDLRQASTCEDCDSPTTLTPTPYGAGVMVAIACPKCGISYDTNIEKEEGESLLKTDLCPACEMFNPFCICEMKD